MSVCGDRKYWSEERLRLPSPCSDREARRRSDRVLSGWGLDELSKEESGRRNQITVTNEKGEQIMDMHGVRFNLLIMALTVNFAMVFGCLFVIDSQLKQLEQKLVAQSQPAIEKGNK